MGRAGRQKLAASALRGSAVPTESDIKAVIGNQENQAALLRILCPDTYSSKAAAKREKDKIKLIQQNWNADKTKELVRSIWAEKTGSDFTKNLREKLDSLRALADSLSLDISRKYRPNEISQREESVSRRKDGLDAGIVKEHGQRAMAALIKRTYNQTRNDLIEALFVEKYSSVMPTLSHTKGVDWMINEEAFDQKVSAVPDGFIEEVKEKEGEGVDCKKYIKDNPKEIARWLYENQDEKRFGDEDRLLIINLGAEETYENLESAVDNTNLDEIYQIDFTYEGKKFNSRAIVGFIE